MIASDELVADFNTAHSYGESLVQSFFKERLMKSHLTLQSTEIPDKTSANPQFKKMNQHKKNQRNGEQGYGRNNYFSSRVRDGLVLSEVMKYRVTDRGVSFNL